MAFIPNDSAVRKTASSLDQRMILFLDGIRYSVDVVELAFERLGGTLVSHTLVLGTFFSGASAAGCKIGFQEGRFVERLVLHAGAGRIDLAQLAEYVEEFTKWFIEWYERTIPPGPYPKEGPTANGSFLMRK